MVSVFPQIDPLPGAEGQLAITDGYGDSRTQETGLHMGRHVIRTFKRMDEVRGAIGYQMIQVDLKVASNVRVRIFIEGEGRRSMLNEHMQEPDADQGKLRNRRYHLSCDQVESPAFRRELKRLLDPHGLHVTPSRHWSDRMGFHVSPP